MIMYPDMRGWMRGVAAALSLMAAVAVHAAGMESAAEYGRLPSRFELGVSVGRMHSLETYLSPVDYAGTVWGVECWQELPFGFAPGAWCMRFGGEAHLADMLNPRGNARKYDIGARLGWGMERVWRPVSGLRLRAGGMASVAGGGGYVPRNSNNPVAARASAGLSAVGCAEWDFTLGRLPVTLGDRVEVPTLSVFFSPGYGETYYEIYLGNRSGLVHAGWWGNTGGVGNTLSATLHLGRWSLMAGWRFSLERIHANNLRTRLMTNALTLTLTR